MATTYYVHGGTGNDGNPGTEAQPFATLGAARAAVNAAGAGSGFYAHRNNGVAYPEGDIAITVSGSFAEGWNGAPGDDGVAVIDATGFARAFFPSGGTSTYRNWSISGFNTNAFRGNGGSLYTLQNITAAGTGSKNVIIFQNNNDYSSLIDSELYGSTTGSLVACDAVNATYLRCYFHDARDGFVGASIWARRCRFDTLSRYGITGYVGGNCHRVENSTFYNVGTAAIYASGGDFSTAVLDPHMMVDYCIFVSCGKAIDITYLATNRLIERRNCLYANTAIGFTPHSTDIISDPELVDPANGDFTIPADSPAAKSITTYAYSMGSVEPTATQITQEYKFGLETCTITVQDGSAVAISGATVEVYTDASLTNLIASGTTNTSGQVVFYLDAGTYYLKTIKSNYTFATTTLTTTTAAALTAFTAGSTSTTITIVDGDGNPIGGVEIILYSDVAMTTFVQAAVTGTSGKATVSLDNGTYYAKCARAGYSFVVPTTVTVS